MTPRAVVFDLFHTLIDPEPLYPTGFDKRRAIAEIAGVEHAGLAAFWAETYVERETTEIDLVDLFDRYCSGAGRALDAAARAAVDEVLGVAVDQAIREPDREVVEMLDALRDRSVTVGVLSNCHEREVRHWDDSPLATRCDVFGRSSRIGAMKPDPVTYRWMLDCLDVEAAEAIYVGNGGSDELEGARAAGFVTVIHCNVYDRRHGSVDETEQRRRAGQADVSVDSHTDYQRAVFDAVR